MSNLLGPLGYQAPTNNMLGRLAYSNDLPDDVAASVASTIFTPTYVTLRALPVAVTQVTVTGYVGATKPSDTAGLFVVDPTDVTTADDGGVCIVDLLNRRWKRAFPGFVNLRWYGAKAGMDITAIFRTALASATALGRRVYVPGETGTYYLSDTIAITDDGFATDACSLDGVMSGTTFTSIPSSTIVPRNTTLTTIPASTSQDWFPAFTYSGKFTQGPFRLYGSTSYGSNLTEQGYVDTTKWAAQTLDAIAPGFAGIQVISGGQGTFEGVQCTNLKTAFMFSSTEGHINLVRCGSENCLFTLFVDQNSEDYSMSDMGITGLLGGVLISDRPCANHWGGANFRYISNCHIGFCPIPFLQLKDPNSGRPTGTLAAGLYDSTFFGCTIEQIGECVIWMLDDSNNSIDLFGTRWVGFASARPAVGSTVWAYMNEISLDPAAGAQQYAFKLGNCSRFNTHGIPVYASSNSDSITGICPTANRGAVYVSNLGASSGVSDFTIVDTHIGATDSATQLRVFQNATKNPASPMPGYQFDTQAYQRGDARRYTDFVGTRNLLLNPEYTPLAAGTANNMSTANGGNWVANSSTTSMTGNTLAGWIAAGTLTQAQVSQAMIEAVGPNPWIVEIAGGAVGSTYGFQINFANRPYTMLNQLISTSTWMFLSSPTTPTLTCPLRIRVAGMNYTYAFDTTYYLGPTAVPKFQQALFSEGSPDVAGGANNVYYDWEGWFVPTATDQKLYLVCPMVNIGPIRGYNPNSVPTSRGGLVVTGPVKIGQYLKAALPSAATYVDQMIMVTDATGNPALCISNGTNWISTLTNATVS